ncbi:MAG: hypothetical protein NVSMB27_41330 [Ktedonobacteraceae bacterium]
MEAALTGPFGRIALGQTPLAIGHTADNQLVVNDPKTSLHHAEIRPEPQGYSIIDLGSTNGTFLNAQQIDPHVARRLSAGDTIRIGDTVLTYEVIGASPELPAYASYSQEYPPGYPPTVAAPPPFTGYGPGAQQGVYQGYQPPPPPAYPAYPYGPPSEQYAPQSMSPPGSPGSVAPVPVPGRRSQLWIVLGTVGGVLVIVIILFAVIAANASTPTRTLNAFCNAFKSGDYQTAYNQLSIGLQKEYGSEAEFALAFSTNGTLGKITGCTVSNVNDSAGSGTITYTVAGGQTLVDDYILIDENGVWKINAQRPRT